jgi:hypothetical protein
MIRRLSVSLLAVVALASAVPAPVRAAEATTGMIVGRVAVLGAQQPIAGATVDAASPSGKFQTRTDADGRYVLVGVTPDTYVVSFAAAGFEPRSIAGVTVLPGGRAAVDAALTRALKEIGRVAARMSPSGVEFGSTQDMFRVSSAAARGTPSASSSGLGSYTQGTVQGAVAAVPGVQQDQFSNVIVQGGKVEDTVFSFDGVPVPQALIAEPGGNVVGAQLPTTGVGYTTVTTAGLTSSSNQGLAAVIDQIPATGVFPAQTMLTLGSALVPGARDAEVERRWATPDLRHRYALDAELGSEDIGYGDGRTFYPVEAATYGLSLSRRATWSVAANAHVRVGARDDLSF